MNGKMIRGQTITILGRQVASAHHAPPSNVPVASSFSQGARSSDMCSRTALSAACVKKLESTRTLKGSLNRQSSRDSRRQPYGPQRPGLQHPNRQLHQS